jgi:hypothetical protein
MRCSFYKSGLFFGIPQDGRVDAQVDKPHPSLNTSRGKVVTILFQRDSHAMRCITSAWQTKCDVRVVMIQYSIQTLCTVAKNFAQLMRWVVFILIEIMVLRVPCCRGNLNSPDVYLTTVPYHTKLCKNSCSQNNRLLFTKFWEVLYYKKWGLLSRNVGCYSGGYEGFYLLG